MALIRFVFPMVLSGLKSYISTKLCGIRLYLLLVSCQHTLCANTKQVDFLKKEKKEKTQKAMCKIPLIVKRILLCNLANWKDFYLLTYFCIALIQKATNNILLLLETTWLQTLEEILDNKRVISVLKLEQFSIICKAFASS